MADPIANPPIQPLGLAPVGPLQPVPNIETRTEQQYFLDVTTPTGLRPVSPDAATPVPADPFAGFEDASPEAVPDAFANFQDADDLDVRSTDELAADREKFDPVGYFSSRPEVANSPERLKRLLDVYRKRREEGLTAKGVISSAVKDTPGLVADIGGGLKRLGERAIDVVVQPTANVILGTLSGDLFDKQKREALFDETRRIQKKGVAETAAGTESATVGIFDLTRQGARKVQSLPGIEARGGIEGLGIGQIGEKFAPPKSKTDQQLLSEIADDAAFRNTAEEILTGQGEAAKNFGLDKETLAQQGIEIDENAIKQLSLVDPVSMVAAGGAFRLVGLGGKVLGTANTIAGAEKLAGGLGKLAKFATSKTAKGVGKVSSDLGTALKSRTFASISMGMTPAVPPTLAAAAAGKYVVGPLAKKAGGALVEAGKQISGEVPASVGMQRLMGFAGKATDAGVEVGTGVTKGIVAASPFAIAADDDATAGALLGAGSALGAAGAAGSGAFRVVKSAASRQLFGKNRPVLEDVASPAYGKDAALDTQHAENIQKLSAQDASELNNFREALRQQGGEIYAVNRETFGQKMREAFPDATPEQLAAYENHSGFFDQNLGDRKVVYLNSDATSLSHEAGHIFDAVLAPEKRAELRTAVKDAFPKSEIDKFTKTYNERVGHKISEDVAIDEFLAEQFAALFANVPVTELNAPKSLLKKFVETAAEAAETLGIDVSAGATTPNLGAPVSAGIRKLFQNAAGEVTKANIEGTPSNVVAFPGGDVPPPSPPAGGVPTPPITPPAPASAAPTPPPTTPVSAPNIRVTKSQQDAFSHRNAETGIARARELAKKQADPRTSGSQSRAEDYARVSRAVEDISASMESGNTVLEIEHLGIVSETPAAGRRTRVGEQEGGYAELDRLQIENRAEAPASVVATHSKTFVPVRWTDQGGTPTLIAVSLDKTIANIRRVAKESVGKGVDDLIPYKMENGKFTDDAWNEIIKDSKTYAENHANGYRGDGKKLVRPQADVGLSIPAENPNYTPTVLSDEVMNFQNLLQGLNTPATAREVRGQIPGNIKAQVLASANQRTLLEPAAIRPRNAGKQEFASFPGRTVKETNPLRNELARAGVNVDSLIPVTERLRAADIVSVKPRPELGFRAPVTDIVRGGFLPAPTEFRQKSLQGRTVTEFSEYVLNASPEEWKAATDSFTGGLTGGAWNLGLGLKDAADVSVLKDYQAKLSEATKAAMSSGDFDKAYTLVSRGQFFREAYEAATGTGSAGAAFKRGQAGMEEAKVPFPTEEQPKK